MPQRVLANIGDIVLRPVTARDPLLLRRIYASSRDEEMASTGWSPRRKSAFLESQFQAQQRHFRQHFPGAHYLVMERQGQPIGRLYWQWTPGELRLIDVVLLPTWRGQGLGAQVVTALQALAALEECAVVLHVEVGNRAISLYERLGFVVTGHAGLHHRMRWSRPDASAGDAVTS